MKLPPNFGRFRWDCERHGCYAEKCRLRFEFFADCFPGHMSMTDRDGSIEINGYYLLIEFKHSRSLPQGQRLYLERQPPEYTVAVATCPDCRTMEVTEVAVRENGKLGEFKPCTMQQFRRRLQNWASWAQSQRPAWEVRPAA